MFLSSDRDVLIKFAGNVEQKNSATFSDDGKTQVATMNVGVASKSDVIVPNPVLLAPYRTFQEIEQPFLELCVPDGGQTDSGLLPDRSGGRRLEERSSEPH